MLRSLLTSFFDLYGGGKGLFQPGGKYGGDPPRSALVLAPGEIPTTNMYLAEHIEQRFGSAVRTIDVLQASSEKPVLDDGVWVVIVRYIPPDWLRWLERYRHKLAGVVYLLDDDIPSAAGASELPLFYGMKTTWRYARIRRMLGRLCSEVWVSTPELARRYASSAPRVCEPRYISPEPCRDEPVIYFYHGTWAHRREIEWLVPVVRQVQEIVPHAWFEIMGTDRVRRLYRGIPRVRVVHPMPWADYLAYAGTVRYQVGLAMCFETNFNLARSHNKVFDITRLGAAGIYSEILPYAEKVAHGVTGLLCENTEEAWVKAITSLLRNGELSAAIHRQALQWCKKLPHQDEGETGRCKPPSQPLAPEGKEER